MFESLKQQPRGMSPRERTRLYVTLGAAAVLGAAIFGGGVKMFTSSKDGPVATAAPVVGRPADPFRPLDPAPFTALREGRVAPTELDADAVKHVLAEVAFDRALRRSPTPTDRAEAERRRFLSPFPNLVVRPVDVAGLDPKESAGQLVELRGVVKRIDLEGFAVPALGEGRRVHALVVAGDDGTNVAVLDTEVPRDRRPPERDPSAPPDAARPTARPPFEEGQPVHVRGYYVQRFQGTLGPVALDAPTVLLVGRDYRPAVDAPPPPPDLASIVPAIGPDRSRDDTWDVEDPAYWMTMHWAQSLGNARLTQALVDGKLSWRRWDRTHFLQWSRELSLDKPDAANRLPAVDPRRLTNESRGHVFLVTGVLASYEHDDWDRVRDNAYDLGRRFVYRLSCDHYVNDALVRFDSPFPISTFPGVAVPNPKAPQRVRIYGVFLRNHSYTPAGPSDPVARSSFEQREDRDLTVPMFVAIHVQPDPLPKPGPLWKNPFFWTWVGLAVFFVTFFVVMRTMDSRDDGAANIRDAHRRAKIYGEVLRRRRRREAAEGASPPPEDAPR